MEQLSIFIVSLAALLIPLLMARFKVNTIPTAVAEIIVGILLGQSCFNIIRENDALSLLSSLGVTLLMFLSGMEINFDLFKRDDSARPVKKDLSHEVNPAKTAIFSFVLVAIVAVVLAYLLKLFGMFNDIMLATIIFMTVALGVVIATLKEKEILSRPIGQTILLTAVLGEVVPLMLLTIYASINGGNAERLWLIVILFVVAIFLLRRFKQPYIWFNKVTKATTQLDIRLAFFLIFTLVTVAERVGAENILGAFLAGMVMKLLEPSEATMDKLTSIGYGFFIPIFFIMTGVRLNLRSLFTQPQALMLIPVLVLFLIIAKLPIFLVYSRSFNKRNSWAGTFLIMTTITIVLPTLQVARKLKAITAIQSDAFILAAVIVCVLGPILFNATFKLTVQDKIKQKVNIVGTNMFTVPVAQELHDNWYDVTMFTHRRENYDTYKSRVSRLEYLTDLNDVTLEQADVFDCNILVAGFRDDETNLNLAQLAKSQGVRRVIVSQEHPTPQQINEMVEEGLEIFNVFNVQTSVLRGLIESPSLMRMLMDTKNALYEVNVKNHKFAGQKLMNLPFVDQMTVSRIRRGNKWLAPHGNTVIEVGDRLIFTSNNENAEHIRDELGKEN